MSCWSLPGLFQGCGFTHGAAVGELSTVRLALLEEWSPGASDTI